MKLKSLGGGRQWRTHGSRLEIHSPAGVTMDETLESVVASRGSVFQLSLNEKKRDGA